jgi:DNA-binding NarL/FixJ family response regulator
MDSTQRVDAIHEESRPQTVAPHLVGGNGQGWNSSWRRKVRLVLVDPCPATRLGISVILKELKDTEVVGEASDAKEALHLHDELRPDLVILDIELGNAEEGLWLCKQLKTSSNNRPQVLVYTARTSREEVAAVMLAGADGYLHKGADREKISETVSRVHNGERIWHLGSATESRTELGSLIEGASLTPRESEILTLLLGRHTNAEVAEQLCLSRNTVKSHVSSVLRKLGLESRQDILRAASPRR